MSALDQRMQLAFPKRLFKPENKEDISLFKRFMSENRWVNGPCPFYLEEPYLTIPDMIKDKFCKHQLKIKND
jgi:hypothetical protein